MYFFSFVSFLTAGQGVKPGQVFQFAPSGPLLSPGSVRSPAMVCVSVSPQWPSPLSSLNSYSCLGCHVIFSKFELTTMMVALF